MKFKFFVSLTLILVLLSATQTVYADTVIDNGVNFLKTKQDSSGKITAGFSSPSQWSAIAFTANGIDIATVKNPTNSLKDFLLTDVPTNNAATDWESRILAIAATDGDPTNFGGVNYVQNLETFYNNNQIGDTCALNDDIFGLLALVASGSSSNTQIKQDTLNFIINKQDSTDGGFSWSAPSCPWYGTAADMTAAAIQALQAAKDNGLTNTSLDDAITKAKNYLLANQNSDGGFGYFGSSDADTTGWVIMAFNVLGMKDSIQGISAKSYLSLNQQSDGGFLSWSGSDATTTAQALIALAGKSWVLKIFIPLTTPSPTPNPSPLPIPTTSIVISSSEMSSLLSSGYFTIPSTATSSATPSISTAQQVKINVSTGSGTSSIRLPQGVIIRRSDGSNIDISSLSSSAVTLGTLSGLSSNTIVDGALQWGIPNVGLEFTTPVAINIFVGTSFNGQTLNITRSTNGSSGWTNDGIVDPKTCTVSSDICSFQVVKASYFAATRTTSQSTTSISQNSSPTPTPTPSPTATATSTPSPTVKPTSSISKEVLGTPSPTSQPEILGATTSDNSLTKNANADKQSGRSYIFLIVLSLLSFTGAFLYWRIKLRT